MHTPGPKSNQRLALEWPSPKVQGKESLCFFSMDVDHSNRIAVGADMWQRRKNPHLQAFKFLLGRIIDRPKEHSNGCPFGGCLREMFRNTSFSGQVRLLFQNNLQTLSPNLPLEPYEPYEPCRASSRASHEGGPLLDLPEVVLLPARGRRHHALGGPEAEHLPPHRRNRGEREEEKEGKTKKQRWVPTRKGNPKRQKAGGFLHPNGETLRLAQPGYPSAGEACPHPRTPTHPSPRPKKSNAKGKLREKSLKTMKTTCSSRRLQGAALPPCLLPIRSFHATALCRTELVSPSCLVLERKPRGQPYICIYSIYIYIWGRKVPGRQAPFPLLRNPNHFSRPAGA